MIAIRFTAIRPPEFDQSFFRAPLFFEMSKFGREAKKLYDQVGKAWKSGAPKFTVNLETIAAGKTEVAVSVSTDNPLFHWLDKGVKGHTIIPRKREISGTSGTYHAATVPGVLPSGEKGSKIIDGRFLNLNWAVPWPGIEARNWSELIREKMTSEYSLGDRLQKVLNDSASRAWKGESSG